MFCKHDIVIQFQNMDIVRVGKVLGLQRFIKGGKTHFSREGFHSRAWFDHARDFLC